MKCSGQHDTTWNITRNIKFSLLHFMLYHGKKNFFFWAVYAQAFSFHRFPAAPWWSIHVSMDGPSDIGRFFIQYPPRGAGEIRGIEVTTAENLLAAGLYRATVLYWTGGLPHPGTPVFMQEPGVRSSFQCWKATRKPCPYYSQPGNTFLSGCQTENIECVPSFTSGADPDPTDPHHYAGSGFEQFYTHVRTLLCKILYDPFYHVVLDKKTNQH